jgi:hypothetical protein
MLHVERIRIASPYVVSTLYRVQAMLSASSGNPAPLELETENLKV